jgi:nucleoside-diphosphate-sugar epimerase
MRVLVTGATGFVGGHLCAALDDAGYDVRGTYRSNPPKGYPSRMEWTSVPDIGPETDWSAALAGVDYVVHLAGLAHRPGVRDEELKEAFHRVNVLGTERLVQAIRPSSIRRLVFVSSAKAIVTSAEGEADSEYGRTKRRAERLILEGLSGAGPDWCVLRPCLVYGPGNLGNMARLIRLVRLGLPLPFASIRNEKNFTYIGNLVSALLLSLTHPAASRRVFALSDGISISTPELMISLGRHAHRKVWLFPLPVGILKGVASIGDLIRDRMGISVGWDSYSVDRLCSSLTVDSTEFSEALGWRRPFTMDEGLAVTLGGAVRPLGDGTTVSS